MQHILQVRFSDEQESKFFIKILNKIKNEKSESLSQLEKAKFFNCAEKGILDIIEIT
jgi:hypothetical protein